MDFTRQSQDSDNQILLPIASLYPPNQIISNRYAPDTKPTFKLILPQKKEKKKVTLPNEMPPSYGDSFDQYDYLGYEYMHSLRHKLVYLKYNNTHYMKLQSNSNSNTSVHYLSGMFIPLDRLFLDSLKKNQNIYKILPHLQFQENKHPPETSFSTNCYTQEPNLRFSSNYESANLLLALKVGDGEYDLILQNDTNSKGNTQWFNFTVEMFEETTYKFNIVNLTKSSSLHQKGMKIAFCSQQQKINQNLQWQKGCHNIEYKQTNVCRENNESQHYYSLHFQYKSQYKHDIVTFASSYPYTALDLEKFFNKVTHKKTISSLKIEKIKIAETLSGFPLYAYSFTPRRRQSKKLLTSQTLTDHSKHNIKSVVFLARQHPGQSQGSYLAEGVVDWLNEGQFDSWKKNYTFLVVPMINIDGVFYGNYRTNLSGNDLNRVWRNPRKDYHCQIYYLKKYLHQLNKTNPVHLIIDLHGHSNSINSFFYGNPPKKEYQNPRLFPYYCSRKIKQISYGQSTFKISEDKKSCARVVLSEMFPKALVYTFQNSFYGWKKGKVIIQHTPESYRKLGRDLVQCYVEYSRLCQKNPAVKERWLQQIQETFTKQTEEDICSESDTEVENQLVDFEEIKNQKQQSRFFGDSQRFTEKKKTIPSIGKHTLMKYLKKTASPIKFKNYCTANDTYFMERNNENVDNSQGFLSIVKINTQNYINSSEQIRKSSLVRQNSKKSIGDPLTIKDIIVEDYGDELKQNIFRNGKLITEKQMIKQRLIQNRKKIQEGMLHSKTHIGFFRYNYIRK